MLCSVCQSIFNKTYEYGEREEEGYRHHEDFVQLIRSVALGCQLCTLIRDAVSRQFSASRPLGEDAGPDDPHHGFRPLRFEVFNTADHDPFDPHVGFFYEPERDPEGYLLDVQMVPVASQSSLLASSRGLLAVTHQLYRVATGIEQGFGRRGHCSLLSLPQGLTLTPARAGPAANRQKHA